MAAALQINSHSIFSIVWKAIRESLIIGSAFNESCHKIFIDWNRPIKRVQSVCCKATNSSNYINSSAFYTSAYKGRQIHCSDIDTLYVESVCISRNNITSQYKIIFIDAVANNTSEFAFFLIFFFTSYFLSVRIVKSVRIHALLVNEFKFNWSGQFISIVCEVNICL